MIRVRCKFGEKEYPGAPSWEITLGALVVQGSDGDDIAVFAPGTWTSAEYEEDPEPDPPAEEHEAHVHVAPPAPDWRAEWLKGASREAPDLRFV